MRVTGAQAAKADAARVHEMRESILYHSTSFGLPASVIAGIISRETDCKPPKYIGDGGHGCGPMQVDDRSDPSFCAAWKAGRLTIDDGIQRGCHWLQAKLVEVRKFLPAVDEQEQLACAIAGYNCGVGRVLQARRLGQSRDLYTAHQDYSADVLARAAWFHANGYSEEDKACPTH